MLEFLFCPVHGLFRVEALPWFILWFVGPLTILRKLLGIRSKESSEPHREKEFF